MNVLVTGGTGFIGSHLIDFLLGRGGVEIFVLVRDPGRLRGLSGKPGPRILKGDLFSIPPLPSSLEVVFHLAGLTKAVKSNDYYTVNRNGTASLFQNLLDRGLRPRVVHLSSLAAGGPSSPARAVREDDPPRPVSPYGESKLQAEEAALSFRNDLPVTVLRVAPVYGPRDEDFLVYFKYVKMGLLPLFGPDKKYLSLCCVHDLVRAMDISSRSKAAAGEVFNIADGTPYSWEDIGRSAAEAMGKKVLPVRVPIWAAYLAASGSEIVSKLTGKPTPLNRSKYRDMKQPGWVADVRKARELLGFETARPLDEAIRETVQWYERNHLL
jgi:nucleoside-diphosphate-sugar epimerase